MTFKEFFTEEKVKRDRCLRKADSVYGKKRNKKLRQRETLL
jgi:hypothetical protein